MRKTPVLVISVFAFAAALLLPVFVSADLPAGQAGPPGGQAGTCPAEIAYSEVLCLRWRLGNAELRNQELREELSAARARQKKLEARASVFEDLSKDLAKQNLKLEEKNAELRSDRAMEALNKDLALLDLGVVRRDLANSRTSSLYWGLAATLFFSVIVIMLGARWIRRGKSEEEKDGESELGRVRQELQEEKTRVSDLWRQYEAATETILALDREISEFKDGKRVFHRGVNYTATDEHFEGRMEQYPDAVIRLETRCVEHSGTPIKLRNMHDHLKVHARAESVTQ